MSLAKKPSTALSHEAEVGVKWKARVLGKPFAHLRMLVGGVIVDDRMDLLTLGDLRVDLIEEADELLMTHYDPRRSPQVDRGPLG